MKISIGLLIFFLVSTCPNAHAQCLSSNDNIRYCGPGNPVELLYQSEDTLAQQLLEAIIAAIPTGNVFFSPYSLYQVLLLLYFGSASNTESLLQTALGLQWTNNKAVVWQAYSSAENSLSARFSDNSEIQFASTNKLFFDRGVTIERCILQKFCKAIQLLDFVSAPEDQRLYINNWVENATYGQIVDLLPTDSISSNTVLVVANAAYFKGTWENQFNPQATNSEPFYLANGQTLNVDLMHLTAQFKYSNSDKLGCEVLELPYEENNSSSALSMVVFLPPADSTAVDTLALNIASNPGIYDEVISNGVQQQVDVKLPKFTIEQTIDLKQILIQMGIGGIFDNSADYSGFSKVNQIIFDTILQKSKIAVDEEGTVAASGTAAIGLRSLLLDPVKFYCNRPFVFIIYDHTTQSVLFNGIYRSPE